MDLAYGPQHRAFEAQVASFLADHRDRWPPALGASREQVLAWQKLLIDNGYAARTIAKPYGGHGAKPDILASRIIAEQFARAGAPGALANQGISMLVPTLLEMGTEEQKRRWVAPTLAGEVVWCQGYSEPGAGWTWRPCAPTPARTAMTS